jgi:hypothetical protein
MEEGQEIDFEQGDACHSRQTVGFPYHQYLSMDETIPQYLVARSTEGFQRDNFDSTEKLGRKQLLELFFVEMYESRFPPSRIVSRQGFHADLHWARSVVGVCDIQTLPIDDFCVEEHHENAEFVENCPRNDPTSRLAAIPGDQRNESSAAKSVNKPKQ